MLSQFTLPAILKLCISVPSMHQRYIPFLYIIFLQDASNPREQKKKPKNKSLHKAQCITNVKDE